MFLPKALLKYAKLTVTGPKMLDLLLHLNSNILILTLEKNKKKLQNYTRKIFS
jgi:hypothetical protein